PVDSPEAKNDRAKPPVSQGEQHALAGNLAARIKGHRVESGALVQQFVTGPIDRAGAGKNKLADAVGLRDLGNRAGRQQVHFDRQIRVESTSWIANDGSQV